MSQEWCAVESCRRHRRETRSNSHELRGTRICLACLERLKGNVARLPELYRDCEDMLAGGRARSIERVRGGTPGGVSLNDAIVAARADMLAVASSWAGLVADERQLRVRPQRTIGELSHFLLTHLSWIAQHSAVNDAVREFFRVVRAAEEAMEPVSATAVELGSCQEPGCDARIYATLNATSIPARVSCERGHRWRPNQWLFLGRRLEEDRRVRSTAGADHEDFG
jgi:hypothetical protein